MCTTGVGLHVLPGTIQLSLGFMYLLTIVQSQSSSSSSYTQALSNDCSFYDPPLFPDDSASIDLSDVIDYVNNSSPHLVVDDTVQSLNADATTLQTNTIQAYVDGTYLPGYRQPASPARSTRHVPRKGGFVCSMEGCNKAFDRNCELK
jgi:hypothetical protein